MPPKLKRQRLQASLANLVGIDCSRKELVTVLAAVREVPLEDSVTSRDIWECSRDIIEPLSHFFELNLDDGSPYRWLVLHPARLLTKLVDECPVLAEAFLRAAEIHPPTQDRPWGAIVGYDEFIPGNKLKFVNSRKTMTASFTFEELGHDLVRSETFWFTPCGVQRCVIDKAMGGWSHMLALFLRLLLTGPEGMSSAGVPLIIRGRPLMIYARPIFSFNLKRMITVNENH